MRVSNRVRRGVAVDSLRADADESWMDPPLPSSSARQDEPIRLTNYHDCGAEILVGWSDFGADAYGRHYGHWQRRHYLSAARGAPEVFECPQCQRTLCAETVTFYLPGEPRLSASFWHPREIVTPDGVRQPRTVRPHETWGEVAMRMREPENANSTITVKVYGTATASPIARPRRTPRPRASEAREDDDIAALYLEYKACGNVYEVATRHGLGQAALFKRLVEYTKTRKDEAT